MEEIIGHGIYHSNKPCDGTSSPASDMQSQRKAGQHSKERKGREMKEKKKRGKKACYHQIKKIDTNRLNLLSQKQEFYIVFIVRHSKSKSKYRYLLHIYSYLFE